MDAEPLDFLPLDLLLALRDAVADPTDQGRQRAQQRAADAGFYLECLNRQAKPTPTPTPRVIADPIAMEPAPDDIDAVELDFRDTQQRP